MTEPPARPTVLVVDDDRGLADLHAAWLDTRYDARAVYGCQEALASLDGDTDVVLLERRIDGRSCDALATEIRARDIDCAVGMVTEAEPGLDAMDVPFDAYLTKPASQDELLGLVGSLVDRRQSDPAGRALHSLLARRATVRATVPTDELAASDRYSALEDEIAAACAARAATGGLHADRPRTVAVVGPDCREGDR